MSYTPKSLYSKRADLEIRTNGKVHERESPPKRIHPNGSITTN